MQSHLTSSFADDGNASWYSVCRVPLVEWGLDCENCRHLTVVGLHDTGPWSSTAAWKSPVVMVYRATGYRLPSPREWHYPSATIFHNKAFPHRFVLRQVFTDSEGDCCINGRPFNLYVFSSSECLQAAACLCWQRDCLGAGRLIVFHFFVRSFVTFER